MTQRLFLDACVLFPPLVRSLLLGAADAGLFRPFWSARVLDEWQIAVRRQHGPDAGAQVTEVRARMATVFPGAELPAQPDLEAQIVLPDQGDAHLVAAAAGHADQIVTFNLRDFPTRVLAGHGLVARHPDSLLWEMLSAHETAMGQVLAGTLQVFDIYPAVAKAPLKRARLPRLAKAWADSVP